MPEFTPEQLAAIEYRDMDACVVAGPGSGKTTVLVERYRSLIVGRHFGFEEILAITFTEKAAANMRAKLAHQFEYDPALRREFESAWVHTIHGFCARFLRDNAIAAQVDPRFAVLDARTAAEVQRVTMSDALDELVAVRREDALDLIAALDKPGIAEDLRNAYDGIRSAGMTVAEVRTMPSPATPPFHILDLPRAVLGVLSAHAAGFDSTATRRTQRGTLLEWAQRFPELIQTGSFSQKLAAINIPVKLNQVPPSSKPELEALRDQIAPCFVSELVTPFRAMIFDVLERFDALYADRKQARGVLDFNDLERFTIDLLERDQTVGARIRDQFRQIMLDEFQDINGQQAKLIALIRADDAFFAVGDINQSIYGFRHARPELFRRYRDEVVTTGKHSVELTGNFRSRPPILSFVESLLNPREGIESRPLVAAASFRDRNGTPIEVLRILDSDKEIAAQREARWIAHRILEMRGTLEIGRPDEPRTADFRDFAILCRKGDSVEPILAEFDTAGIPYVCGRRPSFLASREGRDIIALISALANPRDTISLATVLRSPLAGLSDEDLLRLRSAGNSLTSGLNRIAYAPELLAEFPSEGAHRVERIATRLKHWRAAVGSTPLDVLISRALTETHYPWEPGTIAGDNVESFLHLARGPAGEKTLPDFLREIESILKDGVGAENDLSDEDQGNCVQVMTTHAAKGLEFPVVFLAAMGAGTRVDTAPVTFTPHAGLGLKWKNPVNAEKPLKDSWAEANREITRQREANEEERLLYVAMTRAEEHLVLSYSLAERRAQNWAGVVDEYFGLREMPAEAQPRLIIRDNTEALVRCTDHDPQYTPLIATDRPAAETIAPPPPAARHDGSVSVTSLALFAACPRKYFLQRYLGWNSGRRHAVDPDEMPEDTDTDTSAAELGSLVHELLAARPGAYPEEVHQLAGVFQRGELGARAESSSRAEREWDFIVEIGSTLVRGTIDLWFDENGAAQIVDYKTDSIHADAVETRAAEYRLQLAFYALALERASGQRPVSGYLHFLRPDRIVRFDFDDALMDEARALLGRWQESQNTVQFALKTGTHCNSCSFYRTMCAGA
jgi:ATP-dependent exoDNAse (exonuclease V) beta subunit